MGQGSQSEAAVGEPHPLGIVAKHLVGRLDDVALVLRHRLPAGLFNAILDDELMNLGHIVTVADLPAAPQPWSLSAQAIRKVFDSLAIRVCAQIPRENSESRR